MPGRRHSCLSPEERLSRKRLFARLRQQRCRQRKRQREISSDSSAPKEDYVHALHAVKVVKRDSVCKGQSNIYGAIANLPAVNVAIAHGKALEGRLRNFTPILPSVSPGPHTVSNRVEIRNYANAKGSSCEEQNWGVSIGYLSGQPLLRAPQFVTGVPVPLQEDSPSHRPEVRSVCNSDVIRNSSYFVTHMPKESYHTSYAVPTTAIVQQSFGYSGVALTTTVCGESSQTTIAATVSPNASPVPCVPFASQQHDNSSPVNIGQVKFISSFVIPVVKSSADLLVPKPHVTNPYYEKKESGFKASIEDEDGSVVQKNLPPRKRMLFHRRSVSEAAKQIEAADAILSLSEGQSLTK